jgi:hypothetical protein
VAGNISSAKAGVVKAVQAASRARVIRIKISFK